MSLISSQSYWWRSSSLGVCWRCPFHDSLKFHGSLASLWRCIRAKKSRGSLDSKQKRPNRLNFRSQPTGFLDLSSAFTDRSTYIKFRGNFSSRCDVVSLGLDDLTNYLFLNVWDHPSERSWNSEWLDAALRREQNQIELGSGYRVWLCVPWHEHWAKFSRRRGRASATMIYKAALLQPEGAIICFRRSFTISVIKERNVQTGQKGIEQA